MAAASTSASHIDASTQPSASVANDPSGAVTEDEAALYDRQIRLWGLEAQNRLRTAHILVVGWDGIATETIKNTVLSGIGRLTILDPTLIDASADLVSGFFFRDEEVGELKCSAGPLDRVRALNPLVKVQGISDADTYAVVTAGGELAQAWLKEHGVDVVVVAASLPHSRSSEGGIKERLITLNDATRAAGVKFFLSATYGLGGFYFADQITHDYIIERTIPSTNGGEAEKKRVKQRQAFVTLSDSLAHSWAGMGVRQQRRTRPPLDWFLWLALTTLSSQGSVTAAALRERTEDVIREKGFAVDVVLPAGEEGTRAVESAARLAGMSTLAPIASVLGGMMSQDILNSISGRENPIVNWLFLHSDASGAATVHQIGQLPGADIVD